jgi:hypothetical protein
MLSVVESDAEGSPDGDVMLHCDDKEKETNNLQIPFAVSDYCGEEFVSRRIVVICNWRQTPTMLLVILQTCQFRGLC